MEFIQLLSNFSSTSVEKLLILEVSQVFNLDNKKGVAGKVEFNKITTGGFTADLRAYAFLKTSREVANYLSGSKQLQTVYYLYYLDIISRDAQSLNAILPGLVKEPSPNPVRLYYEEEQIGDGQVGPEDGLLMWTAQKAQVGTRKLFSIALKKACAYQGVLVPAIALTGLAEEEQARGNGKGQPEYFVLLLLDQLPELRQFKLSELYHERLNKLSAVPLLPEWHEWIWQFGASNGLIQPLETKGCEAYLCRVPDETLLAAALREDIRAGQLYTGPELVQGEVRVDPKDKKPPRPLPLLANSSDVVEMEPVLLEMAG